MQSIKSFKNLFRLLSVFAVLSLTGFACSSADEPQGQADQPVSVMVERATLTEQLISHRFSGTVTSKRSTNISTKVMGRITSLDVEEGDYVPKGEVLVRIKDDNLKAQKSQIEASLLEAKAALGNTETNYRRVKALFSKESATQKELDDITTQYEVAKAKVKALEAKLREINDMLDYTILEAPFNGYVVGKHASEGDLAGQGQPIITFEQESDMKVEVTVPETQISLFDMDDTVSVDVKAADYQDLIGIVSNINPAGNRASRQFKVEIQMPQVEKNSGLKSGMFAQVGLTTDGESIITVPQSAIIERGQLTGLYTLSSDSEIVLRWVRLGNRNGNRVEVLSGLAPGENYVTSFEGTLREGQKVSVQELEFLGKE